MTFQIREATTADIAALARVGSVSFDPATDVIVRSFFPAHLQPEGKVVETTQIPWLTKRITAALDNPDAVVMLAEDRAEIVGFAMWMGPHKEEEMSGPPPAFPPNVDRETLKKLRGILSRAAETLYGESGTSNVWELDILAVDPKHRRRGIAMALLNPGLERAKRESKDCYLVATPLGRPAYFAAGFIEVDQLDVFGVPHSQMVIKNDPSWKEAA